jgi:hypothetical protein
VLRHAVRIGYYATSWDAAWADDLAVGSPGTLLTTARLTRRVRRFLLNSPAPPLPESGPSVTTDATSTDVNLPGVRGQGRGPIVTPAAVTDLSYAATAACSRAPLTVPRVVFPVHAVDGSQCGR